VPRAGGQKSRVAFAKLTFTKPHILLLDEPSNHLDIDAVDALIEGLATFKVGGGWGGLRRWGCGAGGLWLRRWGAAAPGLRRWRRSATALLRPEGRVRTAALRLVWRTPPA
jgi:hypothetical protein